MSVLQRMHDSELNASISTFFDRVITAKLGDELNGFVAEQLCDTVEEAEQWLAAEAIRRYPNSVFAKQYEPA
jgi:hypothetical protein